MRGMMKRLFSEGFRVFFLSAGLFAILAMAWWALYLGVHYTGGFVTAIPFAMAPHAWHGHELAFGYGSAAPGGFLLTAVPNWTGAASARHWFIGLAAAVWFAGRVALWVSGSLPAGLVTAVDLAFLPILWVKIAGLLLRRPKPQNVVFLVFLSLSWLANLATHLGWAGLWDGGEIVGPGFSSDDIVDAVEKIVDAYLAHRTSKQETFLDAWRRLGQQPFKEALYG